MDEFEHIYTKYSSLVYRYLLSLCGNTDLAEELTAETFYKAYLNVGKFRSECRIETWLCSIAKNALNKEVKRNSRIQTIDNMSNMPITDYILENISDRELAKQILILADKLKEPYKEVFRLRVIGEMKFQRIADIFDRSESWAKITFYRAKSKIIDMMEDT